MSWFSINGLRIKTFLLLFLAIFLIQVAEAQVQELRSVGQDAFAPGEKLKYRVFYDSWLTSWITAGYGTMTISEGDKEFYGRKTWKIKITGKSAGLFNLFYKVDDEFESHFDPVALIPWFFIRNTSEGNYKVRDEVVFDHYKGVAKSLKKTKPITPNVQDLVSSFYYVRTFNFDSAKVNDIYDQDFFLDDSLYNSRVVFLGRERVKTVLGTFDCLKFKPEVAVGEIFQEPYPMILWVTDDQNRIPVLIKSAVYIGSVSIELIEYSGLRHPLEKK